MAQVRQHPFAKAVSISVDQSGSERERPIVAFFEVKGLDMGAWIGVDRRCPDHALGQISLCSRGSNQGDL
jgi:hypothetical protein